MPQFVCEECGGTFTERSNLATMSPCQVCGGGPVRLDEQQAEPPMKAAPDAQPLLRARTEAATLLAEHEIDAPPVDVCSLAKEIGLQIERRRLGEQDGELRGKRIIVNADHSRVRQRFTIAHEIGHARLHTAHGHVTSIEREANAFAGALLVPAEWLRSAVNADPDFERLRLRFDVSRDVLSIALNAARLSHRTRRS
jgi:hypothetical protein